jgi:hypothetical protein
MGRKHFTEEQIAFALRQHDGGTAEARIALKLLDTLNQRRPIRLGARGPTGFTAMPRPENSRSKSAVYLPSRSRITVPQDSDAARQV